MCFLTSVYTQTHLSLLKGYGPHVSWHCGMPSERPQSVHMITVVNFSGGAQSAFRGQMEICEDSTEWPDSGVE